ncbi:type II toxin-antitoxin system HipA family toxin [Methyloceanibacter sp. wino2]|uniref:type II toxin-antitoxin system HipA family toxin n=1 Tax=Methyloceanibacter sp. wino2 TaxID=2170729 RepID=UPI000D3EBF68|nr:type II toxin-antitoxin system HipA family toxin [Methyloceanibacter sp. wino2]
MNNCVVGHLTHAGNETIQFGYDSRWLNRPFAPPVSTTLPLREAPYSGASVLAVFDNLLPDSERQRCEIAATVGAPGSDTCSLLAAIGNDCAGALQFAAEDEGPEDGGTGAGEISGDALGDTELEALLQSLPDTPLGIRSDDPFRIALAGAQKKTALLRHDGRWFKPHGSTPTTHILKTQIGKLPTGTDLSNSIENEYYCLELARAFGLSVANAEIHSFGDTKALVVERFDREVDKDGRIVRIHQEDMCQALSVHPTVKYERQGGPGMAQILDFLQRSETPAEDQAAVLKAQIVFWLTGATDGHAKNFSVFLGHGGTFRLTPLYDILTVEPSIANGSAGGLRPRLAMSVGTERHHRIEDIEAQHFLETAAMTETLGRHVLAEVVDTAADAIDAVESALPAPFSEDIHETVKAVAVKRLVKLQTLCASS